ncbi:MAG TPA: prenyltransferase/squalene oxidase repeat-containing protein [Planctomycetota bacterium]|nr:prenyltransferase/squalene oxidase repeat-containing protein [Planctomycetota bacterium]
MVLTLLTPVRARCRGRRASLLATAILGSFLARGAASAQAPPVASTSKASKQVLREEITPALRLAVARALRHLAAKQNQTGDFDPRYPVAVNALAGLAFLSGGHTLRAGGEYTEVLRRGTAALLARQNAKGYFDDGESRMYGHGFATLYLAELYGTSAYREKDLRRALEAAVRVIEGSQSGDGGWDYDPDRQFSIGVREWGASDTSITVCQTMALRAARNLGILVDRRVIDNAQRYIEGMQNADGGFSYRRQRTTIFRDTSSFPRSAAGVCILYSLARYNTEGLKRGFEYLKKNYRLPFTNEFPFYAHYYCAQAMFQAGGRSWEEYFVWVRDKLIKEQEADGGWPSSLLENPTQSTAMGLIILQLPYRFLPIHER